MLLKALTGRCPGVKVLVDGWRAARALRLHWLLLLSFFSLVFFNALISKQHLRHVQLTPLDAIAAAGGLRKVPQNNKAPTAAPQVEKELSTSVKEEENSARELDVEGDEKEENDVDAANEVNSVEHEGIRKIGPADLAPPNWRNLTLEEISRMSVMGRRMFMGEKVGTLQNRNFTILIWKYGLSLERRLMRQYSKQYRDPFTDCSALNCRLTYEDEAVNTADAVMFHLHRTAGVHTLPNRTRWDQRWVWMTDESNYNTFMVGKVKRLELYNGLFNWSMSYRMDTDVPVPYGRTLPLTPQEAAQYSPTDYFEEKSKLVAVMGSNCGGGNKRWEYVRELKKHMTVDAYGGCGDMKCPGHFKLDCTAINVYKFYLAFENSNCKEYITEKVWWNALEKGAVPVVMGSIKEDYLRVLPPHSFIHVDDFQSPKSLAQYLTKLGSNKEEYMKYHTWRSKYRVVNEHGYFHTPVFHYCRLCEALNYNSPEPKVYNDLLAFWGSKHYCHKHIWKERMNREASAAPEHQQ